MSVNETNDTEVEGSIVSVIHVDDSATDPERTVLALATKDDLSVTIDESDEDFDPAGARRTRRYRTTNTIDIELTSAIATDLEALELLGIADSDGKVSFDTDDRRLGEDIYIELAYWASEPDFSTVDVVADSELLHRASDVEVVAGDVDPSSTPPTFDATMWVEGDLWINADALGS